MAYRGQEEGGWRYPSEGVVQTSQQGEGDLGPTPGVHHLIVGDELFNLDHASEEAKWDPHGPGHGEADRG
jgi:hypothetical protein